MKFGPFSMYTADKSYLNFLLNDDDTCKYCR